ncbi:MAG: alpha/beta hydrolase [Rudanella sp.]|nr:alpha/beta hydrolase [Rudanella sp.]
MKFLLLSLLITQATLAQTTEPVSFTTVEGIELGGTLTRPQNLSCPVPVVLMIAGSGPTDRNCNSGTQLQSNAYAMLADSLSRLGVAMLRYDKRGSGTNIPAVVQRLKTEDHRFDFYVNDAVGFARILQADKRFSKVVIAGHSEGSLVGMLVARQTNANGFVSLAGAGRTIAEILKVQLGRGQSPDSQQYINVRLDSLREGQRVQSVTPGLMQIMNPRMQPAMISWMKYDPAIEIAQFKGPVLILQGKRDLQVAASEAELLKKARPDA